MRRGEIWTVAGAKDYAGKPRPVVIVQDDSFDATNSVTVCAFTTDPTDAPLFRLIVEPNERNGLISACRLMVDKITTVPKVKVGTRVGRLDDEDIVRVAQQLIVRMRRVPSVCAANHENHWAEILKLTAVASA
jgi:mRNA interferase MazF